MRINQIGWIKDTGAILALIAPGSLIAAVLAGSDNVSIRQKAAIVDGIDLACYSFFEKTVLIELMVEVLGDLVVLGRVGPAERIKRKPKPFSELSLDSVHLRAILLDRESGLVGSEFCRGAVLIRRANEQDCAPLGSLESRIGISRKHRANEIAQMLYTVDVRQRGGNQVTAHLGS